MTNEELQQEVEKLQKQISELSLKIYGIEEDKKPYEVEVPEDIEDYYILDGYGKVYSLKGFSMNYTRCQYERGLAFKTREQAEQFKKEQILLLKLHKWAEEHNRGWFPDWQKGIPKYFAMFNRLTGDFSVGADCYCGVFTKLPYLKSDELAEQFIEEFGDEIKEVLC